jgi:hypothetical protein
VVGRVATGIATGYGLDGQAIESRWGDEIFRTCPDGSGTHPSSRTMGTQSFPGVKSGRGVTLTPHPLLVSWLRKGRTITLLPYGPYGLYRASVPVQGCTLPVPFSCGGHNQFSHKCDCIVLENSHIFEIFILKERNRAFCCEGTRNFKTETIISYTSIF